MLRDGKMVLSGTVRDIREQFGRTKLFLETELTTEELTVMPGVKSITTNSDGFKVLDLEDASYGQAIFTAVTKDGYIPTFSQQPPSLDEIFRMKAGEPNE